MIPGGELKPVIIVRHGLLSDREAMRPIEATLDRTFGVSIVVDNESYDWNRGVLETAAHLVLRITEKYRSRRIILIGHSLGGLVARCANLVLSNPNDAASLSKVHASGLTGRVLRPIGSSSRVITAEYELPEELNQFGAAAERIIALGDQRPTIAGVITIATPNSGAITTSQVASYTNLFKLWNFGKAVISGNPLEIAKEGAKHTQALLQLGVRCAYDAFNMRIDSVKDLTSDRLFRFFQLFEVDTPCVTISGSFGNCLTATTAAGGVVKFSGINIERPHDGVVQDDSVDLGESILPHEFRNHKHYRRYRDCIDAHHCDLYRSPAVQEIIRKTVSAWIAK